MLASALYQTLDGVFVGRFLGATAFAAVNLAMPFVIINFSLADLIGVGAAVPIAIALGKKKEKEAHNIFTCACMMIVLAGIGVGGILFAAAPSLIRLMGAEGEFASLAVLGWGVWAAALATCTGMAVCALLALVPFARKKAVLKFCRPRFSFAMIRQIVACGSPNFLNNIAGRITSILMNFILVRLGGETAVSVYGILMYAEGFIQPLLYGMCDSLQPAVGYNWGAGKLSRVRAIEKCCFAASAVVSLLAAVALSCFPAQVASLFMAGSGQEVLVMASGALRLFALTFVTRWVSFAMQSYMLAIGKPLPASLISVSTALVFPVLLVALLWPFGLTGIWLNFAATSLLACLLSLAILLGLRKELFRPNLQ